jgi:CheY-like chemotaxis protein
MDSTVGKILIVEDNSAVRELMAVVLRRSGYEVFEAGDGLQGTEQAGSLYPDLIIVDLGLPGFGGDELIACIKADYRTAAIPAIVNTACPPNNPAVKRAIAAGAAEILFKPTELKLLLAAVSRHVLRPPNCTQNSRAA